MQKFFVALMTACLIIAGCATTDKHNISDEQKLSDESDKLFTEFKRQGLILGDEHIKTYIQGLASRLLAQAESPLPGFRFFVLKNSVANAMALPNGDIYLNIGLLAVLKSDDQLAAVLAHEIGHVVMQHSLKALQERQGSKAKANVADIFLLGTGIAFLPVINSLSRFNREQEKEADLYGLRNFAKAGFDVSAAPEVFEIFQRLPESMGSKESAYGSHPSNVQRIDFLKKVIADEFANQGSKAVVSGDFLKMQHLVLEEVVQIRLRQNQYQSAQMLIEHLEFPQLMSDLSTYYRGESYRLMAQYPGKAEAEDIWLAGGDTTKSKEKGYFLSHQKEHYEKAKEAFISLMEKEPPFGLAYKGMGLIDFELGRYKQAKQNLSLYLQSGNQNDRLYIQSLIQQCERKSIQ